MTIHNNPTIYNGKTLYNGDGSVYNGNGIYNMGGGGGGGNTVNIGGRDYKYVEINGKLWLAENLDYKFTYNGAQIPIGVAGVPSTPSAWYYVNNEEQYGIDGVYKCGLLYNWWAASYLEQNKSDLLPDGWRVPNTNDWNSLLSFISNDAKKLKSIDFSITNTWPSGWNGTNDLEFNVLPCGFRSGGGGGSFSEFGVSGYFYTCISASAPSGYLAHFTSSNSVSVYGFIKGAACSLRLIKDA